MAEKTEEPTPKKLEDARKEGNVARSKELSDSVMMLSVIAYFLFQGDNLLKMLLNMFTVAASCQPNLDQDIDCVRFVSIRLLHEFAVQMMPFFIIILIVPFLVEIGQIGFIFTGERITPSFKKFNVVANIKNIFSKKTLVTVLKMTLTTIICPYLMWLTLRNGMRDIFDAVSMGVTAVFFNAVRLLKQECFYMLLYFFILAVLDFLWEKYSKHKELMMTREEVKQEMKDDQGSPEIRSRRREMHQEVLSGEGGGGMSESDVSSSTAVVTNPDHYAVAFLYEKGKTPLPVILAKGKNERAHWIVALAQKYEVPVVRNVPLARGLMRYGQVRRFVPFEFLEPVAEILRTIRDMRAEEKLKQSGEINIHEEW